MGGIDPRGAHDSRGDFPEGTKARPRGDFPEGAKARPRGDFPEGKTIFDFSTETLYLP